MRRKYQQAECEKHGDLHQPRKSIVKPDYAAFVNEVFLAHHQPGDVNRQKSATSQGRRPPLSQKDPSEREHRIKTFDFEPQFINEYDRELAHRVAGYRADRHLLNEHRDQAERTGCAHSNDADDSSGQEYGHRIVAARFHLEQRTRAAFQSNARGFKHGENSSAIGSLLPDSISSRGRVRPFNPTPEALSTEKTAAASVDETIEPSSSPSSNEKPRTIFTKIPTSAVVTRTPIVESASPGHITRRTLDHWVSSPPENKINASATTPSD